MAILSIKRKKQHNIYIYQITEIVVSDFSAMLKIVKQIQTTFNSLRITDGDTDNAITSHPMLRN